MKYEDYFPTFPEGEEVCNLRGEPLERERYEAEVDRMKMLVNEMEFMRTNLRLDGFDISALGVVALYEGPDHPERYSTIILMPRPDAEVDGVPVDMKHAICQTMHDYLQWAAMHLATDDQKKFAIEVARQAAKAVGFTDEQIDEAVAGAGLASPSIQINNGPEGGI